VCRAKAALVRAGLRKPRKAPFPVVSVGNLTLGGSEKTPLAMELLTFFLGLGRKPALVTRGYGGRWEKAGGILSDGKNMLGAWEDGGDEPYLVARRVPKAGVFVGRRRALSCLKARELGFDLAVLDDGFQHVRLARDVDIVLYDAAAGGARREGTSALWRADIILVKKDGAGTLGRIQRRFPASVFEYAVEARGLRLPETGERIAAADLSGKAVLAFCGIARPERFFSMLEGSGLRPRTKMAFRDHFPYSDRALERIADACEADGIEALVTTDKDAVKILGRTWPMASAPLYVLEIGLTLPPAFFEKVRTAAACGESGPDRSARRPDMP
jgi:tetraacyldisaccharide 4'-kinase